MISDKPTKADEVIKVGIAEDHPLARRGLVDLLRTTEDIVAVGQPANGEGELVLVESRVRFGRLDPEWVERCITKQQPYEPMVRFGRLDPEWVGPRFAEQQPSVNVTILTATEDPQTVSEAMRDGAKAHVLKTADRNESP